MLDTTAIMSKSEVTRGPITPESRRRFESYIAEIFIALGMDLDTQGCQETPQRFIEALVDMTSGYEGDSNIATTFRSEGEHSQSTSNQIIEGPITFYALCEHHGLPFFGVAHVGYTPRSQIIGISKLIRIVRVFARRFTLQERIGEQIADHLVELIAPSGVAVHLVAARLCTHMRGVHEPSKTTTTFWRGAFVDPDLRRDFLVTVHRGDRPSP